MFNIHQDFPLVSVLFDENVNGVAVGDPTEQTGTRGKRSYRKSLDAEMSLGGFVIIIKKSVDQTEQLHDTLVLSQVLVA